MVTYLLKSIENFIASRPDTALATLAAAGALLTLICLYLLAQVRTLKRRYARILRDERAGDLGELLAEHGRWIEQMDGSQKELRGLLSAVLEKQRTALQGVGVVRYDAFDDVGGQQSFAVAILDAAGDGVILSSVYSRSESRTYAKPVRGGRCAQHLSAEEQQAIDIAAGARPAEEAVR